MSTSSPDDAPLVVGVSGASGAPIAVALLQALAKTEIPVALIVSDGGEAVLRAECDLYARDLAQYADQVYDDGDPAARIASGSTRTRGMVVVPCSGNTLAKISHGFADTLITRAAQVHLKERRPLVLVPRETPLSTLMLRNLTLASEAGAVVLFAAPPYYLKAESVQGLVDYLAGKVLDVFSIPHQLYRGWKADRPPA